MVIVEIVRIVNTVLPATEVAKVEMVFVLVVFTLQMYTLF